MVSRRGNDHAFSGAGKELIRLGTAFSRARFNPVWAIWILVCGNDAEQFLSRSFEDEHRGGEQRRPLSECVDRSLEAESWKIDTVGPRGFEHERTHKVVGDHLHPDLFLDQLRSLTAHHIEAEGGLDVAETQLDGKRPAGCLVGRGVCRR